jgi:hypothetical protein
MPLNSLERRSRSVSNGLGYVHRPSNTPGGNKRRRLFVCHQESIVILFELIECFGRSWNHARGQDDQIDPFLDAPATENVFSFYK